MKTSVTSVQLAILETKQLEFAKALKRQDELHRSGQELLGIGEFDGYADDHLADFLNGSAHHRGGAARALIDLSRRGLSPGPRRLSRRTSFCDRCGLGKEQLGPSHLHEQSMRASSYGRRHRGHPNDNARAVVQRRATGFSWNRCEESQPP
jgi:hypothetical protein